MSRLQIIRVDLNNVYKVIEENVYSCMIDPIKLEDTKFHHNLSPSDVPKVLEHGLLSKKKQIEIYEHRKPTREEYYFYDHEDHPNGIDGISLSNTQDNWDWMNANEYVYNAYSTWHPDIIVSQNVWSRRNAKNYFNEWIANDIILPEFFNSINFNILKAINYEFSQITEEQKIRILLDYYKSMRDTALALETYDLNIPLRETSFVTCNEEENTKSFAVDKEKVKKLPILQLK